MHEITDNLHRELTNYLGSKKEIVSYNISENGDELTVVMSLKDINNG